MRFKSRLSLLTYSFLSLVLALVTVLFFQNCSPVTFIPVQTDLLSSKNNGAGYGGKLSKDFYRYQPGFTCEETESFVSLVQIFPTQTLLTENKISQCGDSPNSIAPELIDQSIYQKEIVGYQEGIFEGFEVVPTSVPANLVEVWCRDTKDQSGIEVISHFDRNTNEAVSRLHYAVTNPDLSKSNKLIPDFAVTRSLSSTTFHASAGKEFDLIVHRNQPAPERGLFIGTLKAVVEGKLEDRTTFCRFGGSLDPKVWPVQQVVDFDVAYINESEDLNYLAYITKNAVSSNGAQKLFLTLTDFSKQLAISNQVTSSNSQIQFTKQSDRLVYMTDFTPTADIRSVRIDGSGDTFLDTAEKTSTLQISKDGTTLMYNKYNNPTPPSTVILKSVPLSGGPSYPIHPPVLPATMGVTNVHILDRQVVFLCTDSKTKIYTANYDGSNLKSLPIPSLPSGWQYASNTFAVLNSAQRASLWAWSPASPQAAHNYIISLDGSWAQKLPEGWLWVSTSPADTHGLFVNQADPSRSTILEFKTGIKIDLPTSLAGGGPFERDGNQKLESRFFTTDSEFFVGLLKNKETSITEVLSISVKDGKIEKLCTGQNITSVQEYKPGHFLMTGYKKSTGSFDVYIKASQAPCRKVNSIPLEVQSINRLTVILSPDQKKILTHVDITDSRSLVHQQLFYIPLDGRPSYLINSPVHATAKIDKAFFLKNSSTVLYYGDQIRAGEKNVYKWSAPDNP